MHRPGFDMPRQKTSTASAESIPGLQDHVQYKTAANICPPPTLASRLARKARQFVEPSEPARKTFRVKAVRRAR
jgi:hypothetical protein